jgi:hypothetical protein
MVCVLRVKPGVEFQVIAPGGFRILAALDMAAQALNHDITITSGTDGQHSGPDDPHHRGEAYDVRTHDLPDKQALLNELNDLLGTTAFYAFIEDAGTENEHIHCQVTRGTVFPPASPDNHEAVQDAASGEN